MQQPPQGFPSIHHYHILMENYSFVKHLYPILCLARSRESAKNVLEQQNPDGISLTPSRNPRWDGKTLLHGLTQSRKARQERPSKACFNFRFVQTRKLKRLASASGRKTLGCCAFLCGLCGFA